jgi:hypothetical protein
MHHGDTEAQRKHGEMPETSERLGYQRFVTPAKVLFTRSVLPLCLCASVVNHLSDAMSAQITHVATACNIWLRR